MRRATCPCPRRGLSRPASVIDVIVTVVFPAHCAPLAPACWPTTRDVLLLAAGGSPRARRTGGIAKVQVAQAGRLSNVRYDIRGPVLRRARQLEAAGHNIIKLNLGNPAPFGLDAP